MRHQLIAVLLLVLIGASSAVEAQRSAVSHKTVVVRQTSENQGCAANCQNKEAFITIPHAVGDMLKGGIGARQVHGTPIDGVPVFPRKMSWIGPDENDLAREYDQHIVANVPAYAATVTAWQAQYGLATATHDLIQKVTHRGREKRVIVNLITFDNGTHYYNGAKVMPEDASAPAQILYVRAIPSAVTPGLDASWNWAGGGNLYHEMRGPTFAPGAGLIPTAVAGAYDEPFDYSGVPYDPDARLKCLVDKSKAGCGQPQPDVKGLIGTTDATYAVLDYYRRIKPVGTPVGGSYRAQLPLAQVTDRIVNFVCPTENNGTYSQVFRFTMNVENRIDRYLVFPDGRHYFVQSFRDIVTSPQAAVPGNSPINRFGEYPNLATRFLHHLSGAFTDNSSYSPNSVSLGVVTLNQAPSCGPGCVAQPDYSEIHACTEINPAWSGNFTRYFIWNMGSCGYGQSDDLSTCTTGGGPPPPGDVCDNIPGVQASPPAGTQLVGSSCLCTGGRNWDNGTMSCQCPSGQVWDGLMCQPAVDACHYIDDVIDPPFQAVVPAGMTQVQEANLNRCYGAGFCNYNNGWQNFYVRNGGIITESEFQGCSPATGTRAATPPNGVQSNRAWMFVCSAGSIQPLFQSWSCTAPIGGGPGCKTCTQWTAD